MLVSRRSIAIDGIEAERTPLLVPSFSSKGFPDLKKIVATTQEVIVGPTLVSSYDLNYQKIYPPFDFSPLIFLDSGGYEASKDVDLSDLGDSGYKPKVWTRELHERVLKDWSAKSATVFITYDHPKHRMKFLDQVARAREMAPDRKGVGREILLKPETETQRFLHLQNLLPIVNKLCEFDIVGVTEKEIGTSILDRMANIARLRKAITAAGSNIPIHVFGSLDTITTPMYFLAGADIFDGLTWLRFAYDSGYTMYKQNFGALSLGVSTPAHVIDGRCWFANYNYLQEMQLDMRRFLQKNSFSSFKYHGKLFEKAVSSMSEMMGASMGGGGGGTFKSVTPAQLIKAVRKAEDETGGKESEVEISRLLNQLLSTYNDRDVELVRDRLDKIKEALGDEFGGSFDQLFGGSVAKHTYVNGLSDIDSLLLIDKSDLKGKSPTEVLSQMADVIKKRMGGEASVTVGQMAVTLTFPDGMMLQVLPALKEKKSLHVPSSRNIGKWSKIDPAAFSAALVKRNDECAHKLVPTIKLAKAILGELPEAQRLSGYHVESLAIEAFKKYDGEKSTFAMLPTFFERARDLVLSPIRDKTGQSVHVDEYMGKEGSEQRVAASHILGRIAKRMRNANAATSIPQWQALFGEET